MAILDTIPPAFTIPSTSSGGGTTFPTADDVEITNASKGIILKNSDASRYRLTVDTDANSGAIIITKL